MIISLSSTKVLPRYSKQMSSSGFRPYNNNNGEMNVIFNCYIKMLGIVMSVYETCLKQTTKKDSILGHPNNDIQASPRTCIPTCTCIHMYMNIYVHVHTKKEESYTLA